MRIGTLKRHLCEREPTNGHEFALIDGDRLLAARANNIPEGNVDVTSG